MSSDSLTSAPYGFTLGDTGHKGDPNNLKITMERFAIQRSPPPYNDQDIDDDNEVIGYLLQSPTNATLSLSSDPAAITNDQQMQRVQTPSNRIDADWTTNTTLNTNETTDIQKVDDGDDLQQVMQRTWNALNAVLSDDCAKPKSSIGTTQRDGNRHDAAIKQQHFQTQHHDATEYTDSESASTTPKPATTTVRIHISDFKNYKTVQLTNVLTTAMIIQYLKRKELLDNGDDWTLFEIEAKHGIERPLRLWEIVSDVTSCWEKKTTNTLLIKKYSLYTTLTMDVFRDRPSLVHGWLNIEFKNEKWRKRYCFIKDHIIYHADDSKYSNSATLCALTSFDVYTLLQPCSTSPTPFVFALKGQDKMTTYEKKQDYVRLFAAENQSCQETWVLGIRQEKSILHYRKNPRRVKNPLAVFKSCIVSDPTTLGHGDSSSLQRCKSIKLETSTGDTVISSVEDSKSVEHSSRRITDEAIKRRVSRRGVSRSGTTRRREHSRRSSTCDTTNGTNETKTSSTATTPATNEDINCSTLIQIDDKFKFSKGSLLDKGKTTTSTVANIPTTTSSLSPTQQHHLDDGKHNSKRMTTIRTTYPTDSQQRPRTLSQRRKARDSQQQQKDTPQAYSTSTNGSSGGKTLSVTSLTPGSTLLKLDHTPERFHTQTLLQRQLKPLLNFNQDVTSTPRR